jgi:hypothetical protein
VVFGLLSTVTQSISDGDVCFESDKFDNNTGKNEDYWELSQQLPNTCMVAVTFRITFRIPAECC